MISGETNRIIKQASCGITVEAENYTKFASEILKISKIKPKLLKEKEENGYKYYQENFNKKIIIENFIERVSL